MISDKLLQKLAKMKAQAEGAAAIGSEAEAQAFAQKLQELLLHHKIHMSDVEAINLEQEEPITEHFVDFKAGSIPFKKRRVEWSENLASVVAWAHFCRLLVHRGSNYITFVGRESDCQVAEYMFVTLHRAVDKIADEAYAAFTLECVDECAYCGAKKSSCQQRYHEFEPNWARARGFRPSFVKAFVARLARRLYEHRDEAVKGNSTALIRVQGAESAVVKYMKEKYDKKKAEEIGGERSVNYEGHRRGRAAADKVNLQANALTGDDQNVKKLGTAR